ncbi:MAG: glycosyl hydrolase [Planctomycetota bacterium]
MRAMSSGPAIRALAIAATLACTQVHASDHNVGRYRFATGTPPTPDSNGQMNEVASFAVDGKVGPENHWVPRAGGRPRFNVFFDRPTEIGSLHVYSGGERDGPVGSFTVQYLTGDGFLTDVPGASVSGNTSSFVALTLPTPVTTTQLQLTMTQPSVTIQEVAVFEPFATPAPIGSGVNVNMARQHRLPIVSASATAAGTTRRSVVDGFVNDADFWRGGAGGNHTITLDLRDPDETDPVSVRTTTTPVTIGSVHLYSGLESGESAVSRGRFQTLDEGSGLWVDVPGGTFNNNTDRELVVTFDAPIETPTLRLVIQDTAKAIREIVPLAPNDVGGWPIGTSVIVDEATDALTYGDAYYTLGLDGTSLSLTSGASGLEVDTAGNVISQHYQVLLNVGTDTYRIRSRVTGLCLEPENASLASGASVVEAEFYGFPSQLWRMETVAGGVRFVNNASGLTLTASTPAANAGLVQVADGAANQAWVLEERMHAPKKGNGGFAQEAETFGIDWAYNWGPDDDNNPFPTQVDYWPMQWGSFNWSERPSRVPDWRRNPEPIVLMGYNEPDREDQANMPATTGAAMWPRLEILGMPLLGPAVAGHPATSQWIQDFMALAQADEMRVDYVGMHHYAGTSADGFINKITDAWLEWDREVVVSEFSVVDWQDTNSWTDEPVYNWFAEVLWRMEDLPYLHRYAVFVFTDDPANPISDNRGEMLEADGSLTPEGKLFSAWDGDTQLRTDTPYHLHNEGTYARIGAVSGTSDVQIGGRPDDGAEYRWRLIPGDTPGMFKIESVSEGGVLTYSSRGLEVQAPDTQASIREYNLVETEHGWFAIEEPLLDRRLRSNGGQGGAVELANPGTNSTDVRWRFAPVFQGVPGPPRDGVADDLGAGQVSLAWAPHGFRDLIGFNVYRVGPGGGDPVLVAEGLTGEAWIDQAPTPGTYEYTVTAVGDTGESTPASLGTVTLATCPGDFNGDFVKDTADVIAAIASIEGGMDYDGVPGVNFFDTLAFLADFDANCGS